MVVNIIESVILPSERAGFAEAITVLSLQLMENHNKLIVL